MNKEFFEALAMLEKEKGIPMQYLIEKIEAAISIAIKRDENGAEDNVVEINPETGRFYVAVRKTVVEEIEDPANEILKAEAAKYNKTAAVGDIIEIPLETKDFGRIAAQAAKHVIRQGIREAERERIMQEYQSHCNDIITATVLRTDAKTGNVTLELVNKTEAVLPKSEQVPGETFADGQRIRVYVMDVFAGDKGPRMKISRTRAGLVERLFEMEVPEIAGGKVLIKGIAREAGSRTKMAVHSTEVLIDPVGACVGQRGDRVTRVVDELRGEKIDIIKWSENPAEFIANALNPANVREVYTEASGQRSCIVVVPDNQLSLAIGKEGQNARLAAKLTGWKIDIKSQSQYAEQMAAAVPQVEDEEQPAQELPENFQPYEGVEAPETPADGDDTL